MQVSLLNRSALTFCALVIVMLTAYPAQGALVMNFETSSTWNAYAADISDQDLVNAGQATLDSVSFVDYTPWAGGASDGSSINNGIHGGANVPGDVVMEIGGDAYTITFNLNLNPLTGGSPGGFHITEIVTFASWGDWARVRQIYELQYAVVGNPTFISLGSFAGSGTPVDGSDPMDGSEEASKRTLTDTTGYIASHVSALRFVVDASHGDAFREIDVFGIQVPEPASAVLLILGALGLSGRPRSKSRH